MGVSEGFLKLHAPCYQGGRGEIVGTNYLDFLKFDSEEEDSYNFYKFANNLKDPAAEMAALRAAVNDEKANTNWTGQLRKLLQVYPGRDTDATAAA